MLPILALSIVFLSIAFANCTSSRPVSDNSTKITYNYSNFSFSYEHYLNVEISLNGHVSGNKSVKILETNSSNISLIMSCTSQPNVRSQPYGDDNLDIYGSIPYEASCSDTYLYLPANATYKIKIDYFEANPENKRDNNTTITVGQFQKPIIINLNGKVAVDNGPIIPPPEPSDNLPEPTRINIIAQKNKVRLGGESEWIAVQLYNKGEPLRKKGVNITFTSDNTAIMTLPRQNYNNTDRSGSTYMIVCSNMTPGRVKVTAFYNGSNGVISNSTYIDTSRWGGIGGLVFDKTGVGPPNANVSLWTCHYNDSSRKWEKDTILEIPENPQLSNDGRTGSSGQFAFYGVPVGTYVIMAEKEGHRNSSIVTIEQDDGICSTGTSFITLSDYEFDWPGYTPMNLPAATLNGGTIWGIACDQNKVSIPNANVSLWHSEYNISIKQWEKTTMADVPNNPQRASDGKITPVGEYRFDNLPWGTYYVMAYDEGHIAHAIVHLKNNLASAYIVLPGRDRRPPLLPPTPTPPTNRT